MTVSRQETPRPLLTPGEILQLPPDDAVVLVSGSLPIRARKLRYFTDRNFLERRLPAPRVAAGQRIDAPPARPDAWSGPPRGTVSAFGPIGIATYAAATRGVASVAVAAIASNSAVRTPGGRIGRRLRGGRDCVQDEIDPQFRIASPEGGWWIGMTLDERLQKRERQMSHVSRFMQWKVSPAFTLAGELKEPDAVYCVGV
jgi:hypothetical protein